VEVGGFDPRIGIWNPPLDRLAATCEQQSAAFLRVAALVPRLSVQVLRQERLDGGATRVELRVANHGYLGSCGPASAAGLTHAEPLRATFKAEGGATLLAPAEAVVELGHLQGWGRGRHGSSIFSPWSRGNGHERFVTLLVAGSGVVQVEVGSCRVGYTALPVTVG
jgi:hypothetical protein